MNFYNTVFFIVMTIGFFSATYDIETKKIKLMKTGNVTLPLSLLCLLQATRGLHVGNDTYKYAKFYLHVDDPGSFRYSRSKDVLYYLWCQILDFFSDDLIFFNTCCALFIFLFLGFFIYKYSEDRMVSILLFITLGLFFASMNQTRQTMAVVIVLMAFHFSVKKRPLMSCLLCVAAMMIHTTAIVFFPILLFISLYPVINKKIIGLFTAASIIIVIFLDSFINIFIWLFPAYKRYVKGYLFKARAATIWRYGDFALFVIVQIGMLICIKILEKKVNDSTNYDEKKFNSNQLLLASIYACINGIAISIAYISMRMAAMERVKQYFMYWLIICIPFELSVMVRRKRLLGMIVALMSLIYMWHLGVRDGHGVIPYSSIIFSINE